MQFTTTILLGLSAMAIAAPVAAPDAAPAPDANAAPEPVPIALAFPAADPLLAGLYERTDSTKACCPKGKKTNCSPCARK